ncbi:MAG: hypothetical protein SVP26_11070 [Chloroflexota bacterium]|nr:hypothetical protein [Chloroflexota bacterium]
MEHELNSNDLFTVALVSLDMALAGPTSLRVHRAGVLVDFWLEYAGPVLEDPDAGLGDKVEFGRQVDAVLRLQAKLAAKLISEIEAQGREV